MRITQAEYILSAGRVDQFPKGDLPEIAFAGRSKVGKSSLINRLVGRKGLAKTSNTPGKTRTLNFYKVNDRFHLVDLPGYGFAKRSIAERQQWAGLIEAYLKGRQNLSGIVHIIDARHDPTADDLEMLAWLVHGRSPFLLVAAKADKLSRNRLPARLRDTERILSGVADVPVQGFSAETGLGRDAVLAWIEATLGL